MNPIQTLRNFLGRGVSPQQIVEQMANRNPMMTNLITMAKNGNNKDLETFARNLFKEHGRNFDEEFTAFRNRFK